MGGLAMFWLYCTALGDVVELEPRVTLADRFGAELRPLRSWTGSAGLRLVVEDGAGNRETAAHPLPSRDADLFLSRLDLLKKAAAETCRDQNPTTAACVRLKGRYLELLSVSTGLPIATTCAPVEGDLDDDERDVLARIADMQRAEDRPAPDIAGL